MVSLYVGAIKIFIAEQIAKYFEYGFSKLASVKGLDLLFYKVMRKL